MGKNDFKYLKGIFKRKVKVTLGTLVMFLISGTVSFSTTTEDSFKTEEYYYMGKDVLNIINVAGAYAQGYTGKGVTLGILDDYINLSHNEFKNKNNSFTIGEIPNNFDWDDNEHGTHVGGIMVASKDGVGMHGIAFDSNVVSGNLYNNGSEDGSNNSQKIAFDYFNSRLDIKVINNSYGLDFYLDEFCKNNGVQDGIEEIKEELKEGMKIVVDSMSNYNKLLIFANGNNGHLTPGPESLIPYFYGDESEKVRTNLIGVTALGRLGKNGKIGVTFFSDLNKYNEENSLSTPGLDIMSTNANYKKNGEQYMKGSGTSMSAPIVTAVGGLVQGAHPYMTGKQIGDVLLSTANKSYYDGEKFAITIQEDAIGEENEKEKTLNVIYFDNKPSTSTELKEDLAEYISNYSSSLADDSVNYILDLIYNNPTNISIYENVPHEIVFGQGVVNAGDAVKGLGTLNARRLGKNDISSSNERVKNYLNEKDQAIYSVNTMGYDATWSNDITETKAGYMVASSLDGIANIDKFTDKEKEKLEEYIEKNGKITDEEKDYFDKMFKFYLANKFDGKLEEKLEDLNIIKNGKEYIDIYNKRVEESGLAGLSVGLLKEGQGTLALTGKNTYEGASISGGGTLQIDGSVAGDTYSLKDEKGIGTISGKGIIKGDLYNYGKVQAGSWGDTSTLTVEGKFNSTGTIVVNVKEKENSVLSVGSIENIEGSKIETNGTLIPDHTYTGFLVTQTENTTIENLNDKLSLFLDYNVKKDLTRASEIKYNLEINKNSKLDSLSGMNSNQNRVASALENMYSNLKGEKEQRELDILYNIQEYKTATTAFTDIYGGLQSDMIHNLPLNNNIDNSIYTRLSKKDISSTQKENAIISLDKNMWIKVLNGWKDIYESNGMSSVDTNMTGFILGKDVSLRNNYNVGYYFAYGQNDIKSHKNNGKIKDFRFGFYEEQQKDKLNINIYAGIGLQNNESEREISILNKKAESRYDSFTFEAGAKISYEISKNVYPYGELNITRYENENFEETGIGVYSQKHKRNINIDTTLGLGLEGVQDFKSRKGIVSLGYERVLSGLDSEMSVSFVGDTSNNFKIKGHKEDKDYLVMKLKGEKLFEKGINIYGELEGKISENVKEIRTSIGASYKF